MSSLYVIAGITRNRKGIIVTGSNIAGGDTTVELIREDGTTCTLPNMPQGKHYHTQAGLVACGGLHYGHGRTSCFTFAAGTWTRSHTLAVGRHNHVSWASYPGGVLLLGGFNRWINNSDAERSTELLSPTSSTTTPQFRLAYDAQ